jgi:hypothetical protein
VVDDSIQRTHPKSARLINELAEVLYRRGKHQEAEQLLVDWVAQHRELPAPNPFLADALTVYGQFLLGIDDDRQRKVLEEALALYRQEGNVPRRAFLECLYFVGWNYIRAGRASDAVQLARELVPLVAKRYGETNALVGLEWHELATALLDQREHGQETEEAIAHARRFLGPPLPFTPAHAEFPLVLCKQSRLHAQRGQPMEAAAAALEARSRAASADQLVEVAKEFGRCARLTPANSAEMDPTLQTERQFYVRESLAALRLAADRGFRDSADLMSSLNLEPLREREEFQELLSVMKLPPKK